MSRNKEYAAEMATATRFLAERNDIGLKTFLNNLSYRTDLIHSDRWSLIYDYVYSHYEKNEVPDCLVTGLTYLMED